MEHASATYVSTIRSLRRFRVGRRQSEHNSLHGGTGTSTKDSSRVSSVDLCFHLTLFPSTPYWARPQPNVVTPTRLVSHNIPIGPSPTQLRGRTHATTATGRWRLNSGRWRASIFYLFFMSYSIIIDASYSCTILLLMNTIVLSLSVCLSAKPCSWLFQLFRWFGVSCRCREILSRRPQDHITRSL